MAENWGSSWPEYDYILQTGHVAQLNDEPGKDKPKHPIGFQIPPTKKPPVVKGQPKRKQPKSQGSSRKGKR